MIQANKVRKINDIQQNYDIDTGIPKENDKFYKNTLTDIFNTMFERIKEGAVSFLYDLTYKAQYEKSIVRVLLALGYDAILKHHTLYINIENLCVPQPRISKIEENIALNYPMAIEFRLNHKRYMSDHIDMLMRYFEKHVIIHARLGDTSTKINIDLDKRTQYSTSDKQINLIKDLLEQAGYKVKSFKTVLNENGTITDSYKGTFIIEW